MARYGGEACGGHALRAVPLAPGVDEPAGKSNKDGEIAQWLVRAFRQTPAYDKTAAAEEQRRALVAFANEAAVQGEKLIACDVLSIFNDRWFGQWLALRRPFRNLNELMCPEVAAKVPPQYARLANTTCAEPGHWADEDLITQELSWRPQARTESRPSLPR